MSGYYSSKCVQQQVRTARHSSAYINTPPGVSGKCNWNCLAPSSLTVHQQYETCKDHHQWLFISKVAQWLWERHFERFERFCAAGPNLCGKCCPPGVLFFVGIQTMKPSLVCMLLFAQSMNHSSALFSISNRHHAPRVYISHRIFALCIKTVLTDTPHTCRVWARGILCYRCMSAGLPATLVGGWLYQLSIYSYMSEITITFDSLHVFVQFGVAVCDVNRSHIFPDKPHSEFWAY